MKLKKNTITELVLTENEIKLAIIAYVKDKHEMGFNVNDINFLSDDNLVNANIIFRDEIKDDI